MTKYSFCVKCNAKFRFNTKYCVKCYLIYRDKNLLTSVSDFT